MLGLPTDDPIALTKAKEHFGRRPVDHLAPNCPPRRPHQSTLGSGPSSLSRCRPVLAPHPQAHLGMYTVEIAGVRQGPKTLLYKSPVSGGVPIVLNPCLLSVLHGKRSPQTRAAQVSFSAVHHNLNTMFAQEFPVPVGLPIFNCLSFFQFKAFRLGFAASFLN